jgi:O-antigen/teichoic acid export membrane protein
MWIATLKVYTSYLSPEAFGTYTIILSILAYSSIAATSWLTAAILRFYNHSSADLTTYRGSVILLALASTVIIAILLYTVMFFLGKNKLIDTTTGLNYIVVAIFIFSALFNSYLAYLRAARQLSHYSSIYIAQLLLGFTAGIVLLIVFDMGITGIFAGLLISYILAIILLRKQLSAIPRLSRSFKSTLMKGFFKYGYPIFFINVFTQTLISSDQLMLKYFGLHAEVGEYAANYILAENSIFAVSSLISSAFIPLVYKAWEQHGEQETILFFRKVLLIFIITAGPFAILLLSFYDQISGLFINSNYKNGSVIIPYVITGAFFVGISNIFSEVLTIHKKTLLLMGCYMVPAGINIILNYIFIPEFGMLGAAIVTMISYSILLILVYFASKKYMTIIGKSTDAEYV